MLFAAIMTAAVSPGFSQQAGGMRPAYQGGVMPSSQSALVTDGRTVTAQADMLTLYNAMTMLYLDTGRLPSNSEGLNALLTPPPTVKNWRGPYLVVTSWRNPLIDIWGQPCRYFNTSTPARQGTFCIKSNGPDMLPDTADDLAIGQCGWIVPAGAKKRAPTGQKSVGFK
ncbi:MAG: type II secretion system protein GspG [Candidatus Sumerlaeota bacterium]|nr:type II secretion system protein GspG [Candidatus Sumerlaeota bacterium]